MTSAGPSSKKRHRASDDHAHGTSRHSGGGKRQKMPGTIPERDMEHFQTADRVPTLLDLSAKAVAENMCFQTVEERYPHIPEPVQLRILFWSFPRVEKHIYMYSSPSVSSYGGPSGAQVLVPDSFGTGSFGPTSLSSLSLIGSSATDEPTAFTEGIRLIDSNCVEDALQIGFHLSGVVRSLSVIEGERRPFSVSVSFDRCKITAVKCSCDHRDIHWCQHVVALAIFRIRYPNQVKLRLPISETLYQMDRDQLQKFVQYLISEHHTEVLPTAQSLADEILKPNSKINKIPGAPDPTAGPAVDGDHRWYMNESQVCTLVRSYLSQTASMDQLHSLFMKVRDMLFHRDENGPRLLCLITEQFLTLPWLGSLRASSYHPPSFPEKCQQLWDQLGALWVTIVLNPFVDKSQSHKWKQTIEHWVLLPNCPPEDAYTGYANPFQRVTSLLPSTSSNGTRGRSVFHRALDACQVGWDDNHLQRILTAAPAPALLTAASNSLELPFYDAEGHALWHEHVPTACARVESLRAHGYLDEALNLALAIVRSMKFFQQLNQIDRPSTSSGAGASSKQHCILSSCENSFDSKYHVTTVSSVASAYHSSLKKLAKSAALYECPFPSSPYSSPATPLFPFPSFAGDESSCSMQSAASSERASTPGSTIPNNSNNNRTSLAGAASTSHDPSLRRNSSFGSIGSIPIAGPSSVATPPKLAEGWIGHPLDPINTLFDTLLCATERTNHRKGAGSSRSSYKQRSSGLLTSGTTSDSPLILATEAAIIALGQQRAVPGCLYNKQKSLKQEEALIRKLESIAQDARLLLVIRIQAEKLLSGTGWSGFGEEVLPESMPMHTFARFLFQALLAHDPDLAYTLGLRAMRLPASNEDTDDSILIGHPSIWTIPFSQMETQQQQLAATMITSSKDDVFRLRQVLESIYAHMRSSSLVYKLAHDVYRDAMAENDGSVTRYNLLNCAFELGLQVLRMTLGSPNWARREMIKWLINCASTLNFDAVLSVLRNWSKLFTPLEASGIVAQMIVTELIPLQLKLDSCQKESLSHAVHTLALQCASKTPPSCALHALTLCENDQSAFDSAYQIVVDASQNGCMPPQEIFNIAKHMDNRGRVNRAFKLALLGLANTHIGYSEDSSPLVTDVHWACALSHKLGKDQLAQVIALIVKNVQCAIVLSDLLCQCFLRPFGFAPLSPYGSSNSAKHARRNGSHHNSSSGSSQKHLLPFDKPPLKLLVDAAIAAYVNTTQCRLAHISPRHYGEFIDFLAKARETFSLAQDGHYRFAQMIDNMKLIYKGKKKLMALVVERFG